MRSALLAALLGAGLLWPSGPAPAQETPVDLELVLAVDASASVSDAEFDLQLRGLAEAFRHRAVSEAIRAAGDQGLAVAVIQWAGYRRHLIAIDWTLVQDRDTAARFAKSIDLVKRRIGGDTAIGSALQFAALHLNSNGFAGRRRIIDISGDGPNNHGPAAFLVRSEVVSQGITINGLAILNENPTLDRYYRANVVGGTGAFVMTANNYEDYRAAILAKLIREISGAPTAARPASPGRLTAARSD